MARQGFIHDSLDIKILLLFILGRLDAPIDLDTLADLALLDGGISYFDVSECVTDLIKTEHIAENEGLLSITEKGRRNGRATESGIPYSVRERARHKAAALSRIQRRDAMICADLSPLESGGFSVQLTLSDGLGEILNMKLYAATEAQATAMTNTFRKNAEQIYGQIIDTLLKDSDTDSHE